MPDSPLLPYLGAEPGVVDLRISLAPPAGELPPIDGLLAGAAEVDITPPPGMPKAGHSKNAQDGSGFRTRLRARVIHLRAGTTSIAIVAGDMHAGSAVIHRLVGQAVADTDIPLGGILLGSTHTHAGPGQFHGCDFYNRWASNRPGFDPAYSHFLAEQISIAVRAAHDSRRPAVLATGSAEAWGFTRNRSLPAHVGNETVDDKRTEPQRKYASINPWLHLLRVDAAAPAGGFEPLAALALFSIHGTGISRHDPSYNADVWAYITGELRHRIERATGAQPVVGAIEGTHGDMTPAVRTGMLVFPEAERVGRGIGEVAADLHERLERELSPDVRLLVGYREIDLATRPSLDGVTLPDPAVGTAKLAGAIENSTPVVNRIPPFKPGYPKPGFWPRGQHGAKWIFGGAAIQRRVNPLSSFPRVLPVQVMQIGSMAVLALPFEVTVEAGRRLEQSTLRAFGAGSGVERAVVSSAANDYWDYLTTPEEYQRQFYEGASTLYGPRSHAFVTAAASALVRDIRHGGNVSEPLADRTFSFHLHRYLPGSGAIEGRGGGSHGGWARAPALEPAAFVEATGTEDAYWATAWSDVDPATLHWHEPLVTVETLATTGDWVQAIDVGGRPVTDQWWSLGVSALPVSERHPGHRLEARWYGPPLGRPGRHRFVLLPNAGRPGAEGPAFD